jgi:hypothetical protein
MQGGLHSPSMLLFNVHSQTLHIYNLTTLLSTTWGHIEQLCELGP